jgi:hypothetical protein
MSSEKLGVIVRFERGGEGGTMGGSKTRRYRVDPAPKRRLAAPRSNWRSGSVLGFGRELREQIARGCGVRDRGACVGAGCAVVLRCARDGAASARTSCAVGHGTSGGCGFGGAFCGGGNGFAGWGIGSGGGGVQESLGRGPERGGGLCEFGRDCDAAAAVGAGFGVVAEGGAAGAQRGRDSFEYWIGLLPAERFSCGDCAV